jgi:hypothetical protein
VEIAAVITHKLRSFCSNANMKKVPITKKCNIPWTHNKISKGVPESLGGRGTLLLPNRMSRSGPKPQIKITPIAVKKPPIRLPDITKIGLIKPNKCKNQGSGVNLFSPIYQSKHSYFYVFLKY